MSREAPADAIRRYHMRGMDTREIERIYGRDLVLRILGDEPKAPEPKPPFHVRLAAARAAKGLKISQLAQHIRVGADLLLTYEEGNRLPASPTIISRLAGLMGEDECALRAELRAA